MNDTALENRFHAGRISSVNCSVGKARSRRIVIWLLTERAAEFQEMIRVLDSQLFDVRVFDDGWRTYYQALASAPNAVVLDSALTKMDVVVVCRLIRSCQWLARMPLIYIDSSQNSALRTRALDAGVSDCLIQPFDPEELIARFLVHSKSLRGQCQSTACSMRETDMSRNTTIVQTIVSTIEQSSEALASLRKLSRQIGVSERRMAKCFKDDVGVSVSSFMKADKMRRAVSLLTQTGLSVRDIAEQLGFRSPCNFSVAFKRYSGVPPSEYRVRELDSGALGRVLISYQPSKAR